MPRPEFEMDPDDLRRLDESVEQIYWGLQDAENILHALSRIDHGEQYRYISDYDQDMRLPVDDFDDSLAVTVAISGGVAVWCTAMNVSLQASGSESWKVLFESGALVSGVAFGISASTWGLRKAIHRIRSIDKN